MSEIYEESEFNEATEATDIPDEAEEMDEDFEAELDSKWDSYNGESRSLEDIQRDKEELHQMREALIKYKESQESDSVEGEDDEKPQKVLKMIRHR